MNSNGKLTEKLELRLTKQMRESLERVAAFESRTVSNYIRMALQRDLNVRMLSLKPKRKAG